MCRLAEANTELGGGAYGGGIISLASCSFDSDDDGCGQLSGVGLAGAPPEGLDFLDSLFAWNAVKVHGGA